MVGYPNPVEPRPFWRDAIAWRHAVTGKVLPSVLLFGLHAGVVGYVHGVLDWAGFQTTHISFAGGVLVLLLVLRSNGGYERWWEARRLWGGIVNQSRNLAVKVLAYGPQEDVSWKASVIHWAAALPHVVRQTLREQRRDAELEPLLGEPAARAVTRAEHMPSHVALQIAQLLQTQRQAGRLDEFAFLQMDRELSSLVDHLGGCERILRTPMPRLHTIKLRRFIVLYLVGLPYAVALSSPLATALLTMLVSYPLLGIERIGQELENPFSETRASHLPLDAICKTIEGNLLALLNGVTGGPPQPERPARS